MIDAASLEVLMYVFQNYLEKDADVSGIASQAFSEMEAEGFHPDDICDALNWFSVLHQMQDHANAVPRSWGQPVTRVFSPDECQKIEVEARGFLVTMENQGVIDTLSRELIIDRAMALEAPFVSLQDLRWVTLIVLFSQAQKKPQLEILQALVLNEVERFPQ